MQKEEFYEVIDEMQKFYGKELNEIEVLYWEKALSNMEKDRFNQIIEYCFREKTYMPKLATIFELDRTLANKKVEEQQEEEKVDCKYCQGYGLFELEYEKDGAKYSFGARCICKNGDKYYQFKSIRDYGILKPDYFGSNSLYKLKPYVLDLIQNRLNKEKTK